MVINIGALKSGQNELVESDIKAVVDASGDKLVKVLNWWGNYRRC